MYQFRSSGIKLCGINNKQLPFKGLRQCSEHLELNERSKTKNISGLKTLTFWNIKSKSCHHFLLMNLKKIELTLGYLNTSFLHFFKFARSLETILIDKKFSS